MPQILEENIEVLQNGKQKIVHHEIDSTSGFSFEDALGMMMPMKLASKTNIKIKPLIIVKPNRNPRKNCEKKSEPSREHRASSKKENLENLKPSIKNSGNDHHKNNNSISNTENRNNKRRIFGIDEVKSSSSSKRRKIVPDEIESTSCTSFENALDMMMPIKIPTKANSTKISTIPIKSSRIASNTSTKNKSIQNPGEMSSQIIIPTKDDIRKMTPAILALAASQDPNIPTTANNYQQMQVNQTVMDYILRSNKPQTSHPDDETLESNISSKSTKTKVYSGQKSDKIMQAPTLFDLCISFLKKNIDSIEYCGGYPYQILRHVLENVTPAQLLNFEKWNEYIIRDTDELWKQHVQRHCRGQKKEQAETWREMYKRCKENEEQRLNILTENIRKSQKLIAAPLKQTKLAFVDSVVKPPRSVQRKQEKFGTTNKLIATPASRVATLCKTTPNVVISGDVRLKIAASEKNNAKVSASIRPKTAPLMAKTLQLIKKGRFRR